jgi:hypothetical protein
MKRCNLINIERINWSNNYEQDLYSEPFPMAQSCRKVITVVDRNRLPGDTGSHTDESIDLNDGILAVHTV